MGYRGGMSSAVHAMSVITAALAVTAMSCMGGGTEQSNPVSIGLDSTFDFGRFNRAVGVHALRFGDSVFNRDSLEILSPLHVNVWVDEDGDGLFRRLSDRLMRIGNAPVRFVLPDGSVGHLPRTAHDATRFDQLPASLLVDGTAAVRIEFRFHVPVVDNDPGHHDPHPEAVMLFSDPGIRARIQPILGGEPGRPHVGSSVTLLERSRANRFMTDVRLMLKGQSGETPIGLYPLDQSGDLGIRSHERVEGYMVMIEPGDPSLINMVATARMEQQMHLERRLGPGAVLEVLARSSRRTNRREGPRPHRFRLEQDLDRRGLLYPVSITDLSDSKLMRAEPGRPTLGFMLTSWGEPIDLYMAGLGHDLDGNMNFHTIPVPATSVMLLAGALLNRNRSRRTRTY